MRTTILVFAILLISSVLQAEPVTFIIDDPGGRNLAEFNSKAPIENIIGTTNAITGSVTFDPEDLTKTAKAVVKVNLKNLKTGIDLRDEHMRSADYLDTDNYPEAVFTLEGVINSSTASMSDGKPVEVKLNGKFTLHGTTKDVEVAGKAVFIKEVPDLVQHGYPGDMLNFDGSFSINFTEYGVKRPQFLVLKLAEVVKINVNFTATTGRK